MTKTPPISREDAEKLAKQIREAELVCATTMAGDMATLTALIEEAKAKKIHVALGHKTFAEYRRATRLERVKSMAEQDVTNRTIAAVLGVTEGTVRNDRGRIRRGAQICAPTPKPKAESVIAAFEALVKRTDGLTADDLTEADLKRLEALRNKLGRTITGLKPQQGQQAA